MEPHLARPSRESVWVEFVGLPGVGKSEVSRLLAGVLRQRGHPVFELSYELDHETPSPQRLAVKLWLAARGWAYRPQQSRLWMQALLESGQESAQRLRAVALNWFYLVGSARRSAARPGIHVFDQGLLQAGWSIAYAARRADLISGGLLARVGGVLPARAVVVLVEAGLPTIRARLEGRRGTRSQLERDVARGRSVRCLSRANALLRDVADIAGQLAQVHDTRVVRIATDADRSAEGNAAAIADAVAEVLADPRRPNRAHVISV
jgi:hypothetical protein